MVNINYLYNPNAAKPRLTKNRLSDKKLGFQVIENGMILPYKYENRVSGWSWKNFLGGIVDSQGEFIASSSVHYGTGGMYTPPQESIKHSSETVIYLDMFYSVWGHLITDNLKRLWFLRVNTLSSLKIVLLSTLYWERCYRAFSREIKILNDCLRC